MSFRNSVHDIFAEDDFDLLSTLSAIEAELDSYIKRGFTNFSFKQYQSAKLTQLDNEKKFDDISIKEGNNHVTIKNLKFSSKVSPRILNSLTNLMHNNVYIDLELGDISLTGDFEAYNTELLDILPLYHQGKIDIIIENVKASGPIGVLRIDDIFVSTNYDLEFRTGRVEIQYSSYKNAFSSAIKIVRNENLDETFLAPFKKELWAEITSLSRDMLDKVLGDLSFYDTFRGDEDVIGKYTRMTEKTSRALNRFVDKFISELRSSTNVSELRLPDYKTSFSSSGIFSNIGKFSASRGYVGDLRSVSRRGNFSLFSDKENHLVTVFGGLGFDTLRAGFNSYDAVLLFIKSSGQINMTARDNSIKFRVNAPTLATITSYDFKRIQYDLVVEQLEDIDIQMNGLNNGPLDWLMSNVATWMASMFKTRITQTIERNMKNVIDEFIGRSP